MKPYYCQNCHEKIYLTTEDYTSIEEGWNEPPQICDECDEMKNQYHEPDTFSDADPGL